MLHALAESAANSETSNWSSHLSHENVYAGSWGLFWLDTREMLFPLVSVGTF